MQEKDSYMNQWNDWRSNRLHRNTSHRRLQSHSRAHIDLFLELNLLRSTIVHNNAMQRAAPSSPPRNAILFVVSPAKTCVYSSKFLASCIHKLELKSSWSKFSWMETWMQNLYRVYRALVKPILLRPPLLNLSNWWTDLYLIINLLWHLQYKSTQATEKGK